MEEKEEFYYPSEFSKSNVLINSRGSVSGGVLELQIMCLGLQRVKKVGNAFVSEMSAQEIKRILSKNYKAFYGQLKAVSLQLLKSVVMIEDKENQRFQASNLVTDCISDNGDFKIVFNPTLEPIIYNLQSNYTVLSIDTLAKLDKISSFKIYETLKSICYYPKNYTGKKDGKWQKEFSIAEFKVMINGVDLTHEKVAALIQGNDNPDYEKIIAVAQELHDEDVRKDKPKKDQYKAPKWPEWRDLNKVIKEAIDEINEKTDLYVEYEPIRVGVGGKVRKILFFVTDKRYEPEDEPIDYDDLLDQIMDRCPVKISIKEARTVLNAADGEIDKVTEAISFMENYKGGKIDNVVGFLISRIKGEINDQISYTPAPKKEFGFTQREDPYSDEMLKNLLWQSSEDN